VAQDRQCAFGTTRLWGYPKQVLKAVVVVVVHLLGPRLPIVRIMT
jgi:hypothetical protein